MSGVYQHTTLQQFVDQLAQDLGDSSKTHFLQDELARVALETRRLWNRLTASDRTSISFHTTPGTAWYDLQVEAPTQFARTSRDVDELTAMQYRLYEPISPSTGAGMLEQFSFSELVRALQQSRDRFLADTECEATRNPEVAVSAGSSTYPLDDDVVRVVRASWRTPGGTRHPLRGPTDTGMLTAAVPAWRTSTRNGIPSRWDISSTPNLLLRLDPVPLADGFLELFTVNSGPALDPTAGSGTGTILGLTDDLSPATGWGALEHLLSKHGLGRDTVRSQFCSQMYGIYREAARVLPVVLDVQVNGVSIRTTTVSQLDNNRYGWEGRGRSKPQVAALFGDILVLCPVPDDDYVVSADVVSQTPTLSTGDYLQVGREQLSGLLSWAKQLALFKVGGLPLSAAQDAAGLFIEEARRYNEARVSDSQYLLEMLSQDSDTDMAVLPRTPAPPADSADPQDNASTRSSRSRSIDYQRFNRRIGR